MQYLRTQIRKWQRATSTHRHTRIDVWSAQLFDAIYETQTWHFIIYTAHAVWSSLDHYSQLVMSSAYKRLAEVSRHIRPLLTSTLLPSMRFVASLYLFSYMASNNWAEHTSILVCLCVDVALCHFRIWVRRYCIFALPLLKFIVRFCCLM
jgi:hypothetical protein